jgi:3-dehydrotetronate 4-kinase
MLIGAIADDLTGATDLALMLAREGMRTIQVNGLAHQDIDLSEADAVVVALKSRTIPAAAAVDMSLEAARRLLAAGAQQMIFKYCSTFDSTDQGNIGPVAVALLDLVGEPMTIACPAFPTNSRTVYRGHLFVGDAPLAESPMKDHPLTPMRDSNLVRVLQRQTKALVGLIGYDVVSRGSLDIEAALVASSEKGHRIVVVDAITNEQLRDIGAAAAKMKLVTGGSGIAMGLPENFKRAGKLSSDRADTRFEAPEGRSVMLAGSCSAATCRQIDRAIAAGVPALKVDPVSIAAGAITTDDVVRWVTSIAQPRPLVYTSAAPEEVFQAQQRFGREQAGQMVEDLLAGVAATLRSEGFTRFLVAGGETSGAVVNALGVRALLIGPEIDPGVPWTRSLSPDESVVLALKSGNFGSDDFFTKAWDLLR